MYQYHWEYHWGLMLSLNGTGWYFHVPWRISLRIMIYHWMVQWYRMVFYVTVASPTETSLNGPMILNDTERYSMVSTGIPLALFVKDIHTQIYTNTHIRTYIHTYILIYVRTYTHTYLHTNISYIRWNKETQYSYKPISTKYCWITRLMGRKITHQTLRY